MNELRHAHRNNPHIMLKIGTMKRDNKIIDVQHLEVHDTTGNLVLVPLLQNYDSQFRFGFPDQTYSELTQVQYTDTQTYLTPVKDKSNSFTTISHACLHGMFAHHEDQRVMRTIKGGGIIFNKTVKRATGECEGCLLTHVGRSHGASHLVSTATDPKHILDKADKRRAKNIGHIRGSWLRAILELT